MPDVFISYSRRDGEFAKRLNNALQKDGYDVWIDWEDIPKATNWLNEIYSGIETASAFILIVSEHSLKSEVCNDEIAHARKFNKRIIPIIRQVPTPDTEKLVNQAWEGATWGGIARDNWQNTRKLNWLMFHDDNHFQADYDALITTLNEDVTHRTIHTRFLVRAIAWERQARNPSFLLIGDELASAEGWLAESDGKNPSPDVLHHQYIGESRRVEEERARRLAQLQQRTVQFRRTAIALGGVGVVAVLITLYAVYITGLARDQRDEALRQVAIVGETLTPVQPTLEKANQQVTLANEQVTLANIQVTFANGQVNLANAEMTRANQVLVQAQDQLSEANKQIQIVGATLTPVQPTLEKANEQIATSYAQATQASTALAGARQQSASAYRTLTPIALTSTAVYSLIRSGQALNESLRLASYARIETDGAYAETGALLAIRALQSSYSPEAESALIRALSQLDTARIYNDVTYSDAVISNDGNSVFLAVNDGLIREVDVLSGAVVQQVRVEGFESVLAVSSDKRTVVAGWFNGVGLWDWRTGERVWSVLENDVITEVAISPNRERIAVGLRNGRVAIYDRTGTLVTDMQPSEANVTGLSFSPNSQYVAVTYEKQRARVWITNSGRQLASFQFDNNETLHDVHFNSVGDSIAIATSQGIFIYNVFTRERLFRIVDMPQTTAVAYPNLDDSVFAFSSTGGLRHILVESNDVLRLMDGHLSPVKRITISEDGTRLLTIDKEGVVRFWDIARANGNRFYTSDTVRLMATDSARGTWAYLTRDNRLLIVKSGETPKEVRFFSRGSFEGTFSMTFSPDGTRLLTMMPTKAWVVDVDQARVIDSFDRANATAGDAFYIAEGAQVISDAVIETRTQIVVRDAQTFDVVRPFTPAPDLKLFAVSSDGTRMASVHTSPSVLIFWDVKSGIYQREVALGTSDVLDIVFSQDGTRLAMSTSDKKVTIWNAQTGAMLTVFNIFTPAIELKFANQDTVLLGRDGDLLVLWQSATGQELRRINLPNQSITDFVVTADGTRFWTATGDNALHLWDVNIQLYLQYACSRVFRLFTDDEKQRYGVTVDKNFCPRYGTWWQNS